MRSKIAVGRHRYAVNHGFTLIEVMVVVVILGILAAIVVPKIMDNPDKARKARAESDIRNISTALALYRLDNFAYPSTDQGLEALVRPPADLSENANWKKGGYIGNVPQDPWGRPYRFLQPGSQAEFDVYSTGADGQRGGEGINKDIGSWDLN